MFVTLACAISDFLTYSMLYGWKTKEGVHVLPVIVILTPLLLYAESFDEEKEEIPTPTSEVLRQSLNVENDFGKAKQKKKKLKSYHQFTTLPPIHKFHFVYKSQLKIKILGLDF